MTRDDNLLLRAADLLRDRANAASKGEWAADGGGDDYLTIEAYPPPDDGSAHTVAKFDECGYHPGRTQLDAEYIALMHPPVALALADWLEREDEHTVIPEPSALEVARAVLRLPALREVLG